MRSKMVPTFFVLLVFSALSFFPLQKKETQFQNGIRGLIGETAVSAAAVALPVSWTNVQKSAVSGSSLRKSSGSDQWFDAGANSAQQITSGDGFVEFTAVETNKDRYAGLTYDYTGNRWNTINFGIHLTTYAVSGGYVAEVRENGIWKAETTYQSNQVFRIAIEGEVVKYYKGTTLFYTSRTVPRYPLVFDAVLLNLNSTIGNALIATSGSAAAPSPTATPLSTPSPTPPSVADTTPPVISSVSSSSVTSSGASIGWTTNESSTSQVDYGLTSALGSSASLTTLNTSHRLSLIGLPASTTCYYRVRARDAAGNTATSPTYSFVTLAAADTTAPVLSAITSSSVTSTGATISWTTNEASDSQIEYGTTTAYGNTTSLATLLTNHQMSLIGLSPNKLYHYRVKSKDAAGNQATSGNYTFTTTGTVASGGAAGMLDDKRPYLPPSYTSFAMPALGGSYTDPVYGTNITRLTNGPAQFNDSVHHEYSSMTPFNADNTRILLQTEARGWVVMDLRGNVIVSHNDLESYSVSEPRWSTSNPNVFFYHGNGTNQLKKYDIVAKKETLVRTFTQFSMIDFGGGESDISDDGDHMLIRGDNRYIGVYTFSTDRLGATLDISTLGTYDYWDLTANNNVIVRWNAEGTGRYRGFELYSQEMAFLRQVHKYGAHADRGRDLNGDEVLLVLSSSDLNPPPGCENNGIEKVRLSDGQRTCLMALNWSVGAHISANSNGSNPWVIVELTDEIDGTANPNATLSSSWQSVWKPYFNEILMVKMDGSEVRRLAHHRSRTLDWYWYQPRAAVSRDGSYAVFDSNFATYPLANYTDVFMIKLK